MNIRNLDLRSYAVMSLLILWAVLTFSIALTEITFVCALIFWVSWHIQLKKGLPSQNIGGQTATPKIDWALWAPLALFFIFVVASYFTSEYPKQSFRGLLKIAKPLLVFIMAAELFRDTNSQKRFDGFFLATFLLVTIDCSIQYAFGKDLLRGFAAEQSGSGIRLSGPFGNFAIMATYLVLVIPVFGMRFWNDFKCPEHRRKSFLNLALALAGFLLLYLTLCRGPLVALVISSLILFIYKRWFKMLTIALLLCLALLAIAPRGVIIHQDAHGKEQSLGERYYLWRRAIDVIVAKPFSGTGINTYSVAHAKYDTLKRKNLSPLGLASTRVQQNQNGSVSFITGDAVLTSDEKQTSLQMGGKKYNLFRNAGGNYFCYDDLIVRNYYAHNGYLQLAAEIGLPGIFFFLLFLFMFFRRALHAIKKIRGTPEEYIQLGLLTALLAFLIYAATDNNLQSPPSLMKFWLLAGVLMARQCGHPQDAAS